MSALAPPASRATLLREIGILLPLAIPLILGQLFSFGTDVVSTLLAGHLGASVLAAVSVGTSLWIVIFVVVVGLMMSVQPTVAQLDGAGQRAATAGVFRQGVILGLSIGLLCMVIVATAGRSLAAGVGVPPNLLSMASGFLLASTLSFPALGLLSACRGFSEGLSRTRPTMVCGAIGLLMLGPIGYALMYGIPGVLPGLGATGDGLALSAVLWAEALAYLAWIRLSGRYGGVDWDSGGWRPDFAILLRLLRIGLPISVTLLLEVTMFSAATLVVAHFGAVAVAAHQIAMTMSALFFMVPLGLSLGVTVRVARFIGQGDPESARRAGTAGFVLMLATQTVSFVVLLCFAHSIAGVFTEDLRVAALASLLLGFAAVFQFSDGTQVVANGALRGLPDTRMPMLLVLLSYWAVGMPTAIWLAFSWRLGPAGIWIGLTAGLSVAALLLTGRFFRATRPRLVLAGAPFLSPGETR
jgi:MATE family multidrug resistance protein